MAYYYLMIILITYKNYSRLKQELAELLAEEAKVDKLRSLPLFSCRITGWKFVCSKCYERYTR